MWVSGMSTECSSRRIEKTFTRMCGMTHVRTSPFYPQSNGKMERWHRSLKRECIRPGMPLCLEDALPPCLAVDWAGCSVGRGFRIARPTAGWVVAWARFGGHRLHQNGDLQSHGKPASRGRCPV